MYMFKYTYIYIYIYRCVHVYAHYAYAHVHVHVHVDVHVHVHVYVYAYAHVYVYLHTHDTCNLQALIAKTHDPIPQKMSQHDIRVYFGLCITTYTDFYKLGPRGPWVHFLVMLCFLFVRICGVW